MHEVLFDDRFLKDTGVTTLDFAKALIDEGYHPMTMYFPLVVHGALLIEPTETESKESLDQFIAVLRGLAERARSGDAARFPRRAAPDAAPPPRRDRRRPQAGAALAPAAGAASRRRSRLTLWPMAIAERLPPPPFWRTRYFAPTVMAKAGPALDRPGRYRKNAGAAAAPRPPGRRTGALLGLHPAGCKAISASLRWRTGETRA